MYDNNFIEYIGNNFGIIMSCVWLCYDGVGGVDHHGVKIVKEESPVEAEKEAEGEEIAK